MVSAMKRIFGWCCLALALLAGCKPKEQSTPQAAAPQGSSPAASKEVQVSPPPPSEEEVLPDPPVGEEEPMPAGEPAGESGQGPSAEEKPRPE